MAYDVSDVELYQWQELVAWAGTGTSRWIIGPRGKVGFVRDLIVEVTTSMVGTTTVPELQVGISSGDFTYGRYRLGTATATGYSTGPHRASCEAWTGNPPRTLADFTGHVVLDGGPTTSAGIAGGSYGTVVPKGRIPANGAWVVTNAIQGVDSSHTRLFGIGMQPFKDLTIGMFVLVQGLTGAAATSLGVPIAISAVATDFSYIEVAQAFSTTWTGGGIINLCTQVTLLPNGAASGAGGGIARVKIQWLGGEEV